MSPDRCAWEQAYPAPAKINLFLHVVGRRLDGYHLLQTAFRLLDFGDTLRFAPRGDGRIRRADPLPGVGEDDDLTVRAARLLQKESGSRMGAEITLTKRLPMGGGVGGGSSDAATTLLALNCLWGLHWPRERLQDLALRLGADVPFFVFGRSAFAEGIGEALQAVALPPAWYVVLVPEVSVPTREIFAAENLTRDTKAIKMADFSAGWGRNDLEPVACERFPGVARAIAWLGRFGDARMTGSGACVFAAFATEQEARAVLARLPEDLSGWVARGMDEHPLRDLAE